MRRITAATLLAATVTIAVTAGACNYVGEGERCNPAASSSECSAGLACFQPVDCPETYCCPTTHASKNPYCQSGCNGGQASICTAGGDADCADEGTDGGAD